MAQRKKAPEEVEAAIGQLDELRREIEYDTRDYSIDFLVQQFRDNEFYIPDEYQRQYIWLKSNKNLFIESILLGLPIPFMFSPIPMMGAARLLTERNAPKRLSSLWTMT